MRTYVTALIYSQQFRKIPHESDSRQNQHSSQYHCPQHGKPDLVSAEEPEAAFCVFLRADFQTLLTLEAIPADLPGAICWKTDLRRAGLRTCFTSFSAIFSRSVKGEKRQYRKQGKYCSHGAEEPAKESFLYTHASHQKEQDHKADPIASQTEVSCMDHGKYIPRTCSLRFIVYTAIAHKYDDCQNHIFQIYKSVCNPVRNLHRFLFHLFADASGSGIYGY